MLPLGPQLLAVLEALKAQQAADRILVEECAGSLVFCQPNGKPGHGHNVTQRTSLKKHPLDLELMKKLLREAPLLWETGNQRVRRTRQESESAALE